MQVSPELSNSIEVLTKNIEFLPRLVSMVIVADFRGLLVEAEDRLMLYGKVMEVLYDCEQSVLKLMTVDPSWHYEWNKWGFKSRGVGWGACFLFLSHASHCLAATLSSVLWGP